MSHLPTALSVRSLRYPSIKKVMVQFISEAPIEVVKDIVTPIKPQ